MDFIPDPVEHDQNVDNKADQVFRTHVIVREVLKHLSNPEVLELSVVNKVWKCVAHSVLSKRDNLLVHLKCTDDDPCEEDIEALEIDFGHMDVAVVPISGISIIICHLDDAVCPCPTEALDLTRHPILNRLSLKQASVELLGRWWEYTDCPGFMVAKQVLQHFSGTLEQLTLNIWLQREHFIEQVVRNCSFQSLKILKLGEEWETSEEDYTNYVKGLVSRAPNLQELHVEEEVNLADVLESISVVLVLKSQLSAPFDDVPENGMSAVRLENMKLIYTGPIFNFERFNRIAPMLLQTSCATLRQMRVDGVLAVPLMHYGICLQNVTDLHIFIDYSQLELIEPRILGLVKNFDFTRLLPSLSRVTVSSFAHLNGQLSDDVRDFIEQADGLLREPKPDRAVNIKHLILDGDLFDVASQFFAEMFPTVEKLHVAALDETEFSFGSVCQHWVRLEALEVTMRRPPTNLDSFFCGIFPEEVESLRQKDEEYLKKLHIVPVMPAITCLRNLRTFVLDLGYSCDPPMTYSFSKSTGLIAFTRCPDLAVTLVTKHASVYEELSHMKPYVSVVSTYHFG